MNVLIDTHALLWFCEGSNVLSGTARNAMEDSASQRYVSHATIWEIAIKVGLGKLKLQFPYKDFFPDLLNANGFSLLPTDFEHYRALIKLPVHHRDPFDRLLIAQAIAEGLSLVTCDPNMAAYGVPLVW